MQRIILLAVLTISTSAARFTLLHSSLDSGGGLSVSQRFEATSSIHPIAGAGHSVLLNYPPNGAKDHVPLPAVGSHTFSIADLLRNDADPEENALIFSLPQTNTTHGGSLLLSNGNIIYTPPPEPNPRGDSFTYVVSDSLGVGSIGKAILFSPAAAPVLTDLQQSGTEMQLTFKALPDSVYMLQFRSAFDSQHFWNDYPDATQPFLRRADEGGIFQFVVPIAFGRGFFRAVDLESLQSELSFKKTGGQLAMNLRGQPNTVYKLQARATLDSTDRWIDYPDATQPFLVRASSDGIYQVIVPIAEPYSFFRSIPHQF